jgi:hypothetical protein
MASTNRETVLSDPINDHNKVPPLINIGNLELLLPLDNADYAGLPPDPWALAWILNDDLSSDVRSELK